MNKSVLGTILAIVAILAVVGVVMVNKDDTEPTVQQTPNTTQTDSETESNGTTPSTNEEATETNAVDIQSSTFSPSNITVKKGSTVTWTNKDSLQHTVTPDDETAEFKASNSLSRNESYSVTFNTAGIYTYHCDLHPDMTGTVTVTE